MAGKGKAKAGRSIAGDMEFEDAWKDRAPRAADGPEQSEAAPDGSGENAFMAFGEGQAGAEARLYAYHSLMMAGQPSQFPPMAELSSRLGEFGMKEPANGEQLSEAHARSEASLRGPDWFEHRIDELKELVSGKDEGSRHIRDINGRLAEIAANLEKLSGTLPSGAGIAALDSKVDALSHSLNESRERSAADSDRIARAAKEIHETTTRIRDLPARVEATAGSLGQTVAAAASRAAMLAAGHAVQAMREHGVSGVERLETELRELNRQSREAGERTAEALDRVHNTLRDFLERGQARQEAAGLPQAKKRATLKDPIASPGSEIYYRGEKESGAGLSSRPRAPAQPLFQPPQDTGRRFERERPVQDSSPAQAGREDFKSLPLAGIAVVAFVLLLVSGALYYLHTQSRVPPLHQTVAPGMRGAASSGVRAPAAAHDAPLPAAADMRAPRTAEGDPALFTAWDRNSGAAVPRPASPADDLKVLEAAARHGDREAQFRIGALFLSETDIEGGAATAARWLARAADQGHVEAQFLLASLFERGAGVSKDESQAIELYRKAAGAGHVRAMHNLGVLLSSRGSAQDYREAASWFGRAAQAGLRDSQYNVALLYERGLGLEQDLPRAYFWYRVAGKAGDAEAARQAERLKRTLPPETAAAASDQAGSWKPVVEESSKRENRRGARG